MQFDLLKKTLVTSLIIMLLKEAEATMQITSSVFEHEGEIPTLYTCEGKDISPPLQFHDIPKGTKSLALIVDDPDAPDPKAPKMLWIHWVLYNIDPNNLQLTENVDIDSLRASRGMNSWDKNNYGGPCPPIGRHRYYHKLYALDIELSDLKNPTANELLRAMDGHILSEAILMGTYQKKHE